MKFSTALKISGVCLLALAAEVLLSYQIYSNYAFTLAETGQYSAQEAYSTGPMATVAQVFYGIFGVTLAIGIGAPLVSLVTMVIQGRSRAR